MWTEKDVHEVVPIGQATRDIVEASHQALVNYRLLDRNKWFARHYRGLLLPALYDDAEIFLRSEIGKPYSKLDYHEDGSKSESYSSPLDGFVYLEQDQRNPFLDRHQLSRVANADNEPIYFPTFLASFGEAMTAFQLKFDPSENTGLGFSNVRGHSLKRLMSAQPQAFGEVLKALGKDGRFVFNHYSTGFLLMPASLRLLAAMTPHPWVSNQSTNLFPFSIINHSNGYSFIFDAQKVKTFPAYLVHPEMVEDVLALREVLQLGNKTTARFATIHRLPDPVAKHLDKEVFVEEPYDLDVMLQKIALIMKGVMQVGRINVDAVKKFQDKTKAETLADFIQVLSR